MTSGAINISIENILCHSNWNVIGAIDAGILTILVGKSITPIGIPIIAVIIIPTNKAPFTFLANNIDVITIPIKANNPGPDTIFPRANIVPPPSGWTTIPAPSRPIRAINNPIPTDIAFFIFVGIESTIASRTLNTVNPININPSKRTAVNANWYEYPIPKTIVYAKNAFNPIPGAWANGSLAYNPIIKVPTIADSAVAVNTAP